MAIDLYSHHFGFSGRPFSMLPDPDLIFWSKNHTKAFAILEYGIETAAPLTVVTGEVGTGKTTLVQTLLRNLSPDLSIGLISNAQGDRGDLLRWVLNALEVSLPEERDYVALFQHFQDFAIAEYAEGRRVVLIFDEAQNLGADMLEELRMLTNINSGTDELLQIILTGQPELRDLITQPSLRQFAQRVMASFHLNPFFAEETEAYIRHRLKKVGGTGQEFDTLAIRAIHNQSGGIPRLINRLAEIALVYAAASEEKSVTVQTIAEIKKDDIALEARQAPYHLSPSLDKASGEVGE